MRALALLISLALPVQAAAAPLVRSAPPRGSARPPVGVPTLPLALAVPAAAAGTGAAQTTPQRLAAVAERVAAAGAGLEKAPGEGAAAVADGQIRLLQGAEGDSAPAVVAAPVSSSLPAPLPPAERETAVRRMKAGSMAFKFGLDSMGAAIPFVAMATLGGATAVALLVVGVYGLAQAAAGSWAGALTQKVPASAVVSIALVSQAVLLAATAGLGAAALLPAWTLYPLYGAVGAAVGAAETSRRILPVLVLGQDEEALRRYNAELHRRYEIAGVSGAAAAGLAMWFFGTGTGPLVALAVAPAAAVFGAWQFWRVRHPQPGAGSPDEPSASVSEALRLLRRDGALRAIAAAMLLPQIVHRLLENLVLPVYAKGALGVDALSAAMLTASNAGELLGASLLIRYAAKIPDAYRWVRWGAYGGAAAWVMSLALTWGLTGLWGFAAVALPILVMSATWAASHVSLETEVQKRVEPRLQPRVFSLLFSTYVVGSAAASYFVGRLIDGLTLGPGLLAVNAAIAVVALIAWLAAGRLKR
jgi:hypothetical protein